MYKLVIIGTILASAFALRHPVNEERVAEIKKRATSWTPMEVADNPLSKLTVDEVYGMLGAIPGEKVPFNHYAPVDLNAPAAFDWTTANPGCIHSIRDQASCGSCWAFAASEELSDRFCIKSNGAINVVLSPQDMVSCDPVDMGCSGGWLLVAHQYMQQAGIVSDACMPYISGGGISHACPAKGTCPGVGVWQKYYCDTIFQPGAQNIAGIQTELVNNGPMEVAFTVYNDFFSYSSGVYVSHPATGVAGGHAIKLVGYGHDDASGLDYWKCANSWGPSWGENGFFRIQVKDVSGIDDQATSCLPILNQVPAQI